jgi:hypothetical protein
MAALTQTRALNPRAFTVTYGKPSRKAFQPTNGTRWTMKRKDSYMVEVRSELGRPAACRLHRKK